MPLSDLAPPDVTRLADLTGLDRLGLPVWQAIRPTGRSLSCHLGKGMTEDQAIGSALGEARECADCEAFQPAIRLCRWVDLPAPERTPAPDDFAVRRGALGPHDEIEWSRVDVLDGAPFWVPADAIGIDFTRPCHPAVLRATDGQATGVSFAQAMRRALLERVERDAVARFRSMGAGERLAWSIDPASVELPWFQRVLERAGALGMRIGVHRLPALGQVPAFQVSIAEIGAPAASCRLTAGWGAGFTTAVALQAALLEAAQSRAGHIAGARDDIALESPPSLAREGLPFATGRRRFRVEGADPESDSHAVAMLSRVLADAGFGRIGHVTTSAEGARYTTVKCFVPGLGQEDRTARIG